MTARLFVESINTVGFVDKGANPEADLLIWKRHPVADTNQGGRNMAFEKTDLAPEALEAFDAQEAKITELQTQIDEASAGDAGEGGETEAEKMMKALPEEVRAHLAKVEADLSERMSKAEEREKVALELAKAERRERQVGEFKKMAENDLPLIQGEADAKAELLYAVNEALTEEQYDSLITILRAANAQIELTGEIGGTGDDDAGDTPWAQVQTMAAELVKSDSKLSVEQAITQIISDPKNRVLAAKL